ncbi:MAG: hypothetical protein ABFD92_21650 [Planctomycetaceae bacterium]
MERFIEDAEALVAMLSAVIEQARRSDDGDGSGMQYAVSSYPAMVEQIGKVTTSLGRVKLVGRDGKVCR